MLNNLRRRRGANAVEFALALPALVFILSGTIDYGWYFHQQMHLVTATGQGARAGASADDQSSAITTGNAVANDVWSAAGVGTFPIFNTALSGTAPDIKVTTSAETDFIPLVGLVPTPSTMAHAAVFRLANQ